jgi:PilZ domain
MTPLDTKTAVNPATSAAGGTAVAEDSTEKRVAQRVSAASVPWITGIRLSPSGGEASLVNISATGILARSSAKLMAGTVVTVHFDGTRAPGPARSRVVRCGVADIDKTGRLWYHIGIAFNNTIALEEAGAGPVIKAVAESKAPAAAVSLLSVNRW